jgi:hypothetical protein
VVEGLAGTVWMRMESTIGSFRQLKGRWHLWPFAGPWTDFALWRLSLCLLAVVALQNLM